MGILTRSYLVLVSVVYFLFNRKLRATVTNFAPELRLKGGVRPNQGGFVVAVKPMVNQFNSLTSHASDTTVDALIM